MLRSNISYIFLFYFCVLMVVMVVTARFQNSPNRRRIYSGVEPGRKTGLWQIWHQAINAINWYHRFVLSTSDKKSNVKLFS